MRFSFSSGSFPTFSLPTVFELGANAGADAIEIMLTPRLSDQGATRLRFLEERFGLMIASAHSVIRLRRSTLDEICHDILDSARLAARLSYCRTLVVHVYDGGPDAGEMIPSRWIDTVLEAREILARVDASVSIENPDPARSVDPQSSWRTLMRWNVLAQEFGLNTTYDTSHAARSGWDILEFATQPGERLDNVHLSDLGGRPFNNGLLNSLLHQHRPPGTGSLELERFLARLAQTAYSGLITLEISPLRVPWYWLPSAQRTLAEMLLFCRRATGDARQVPLPPRVRRTTSLDS